MKQDHWASIDDRVIGYEYNNKFWCLKCLPYQYKSEKLMLLWRDDTYEGLGIVCHSCGSKLRGRKRMQRTAS